MTPMGMLVEFHEAVGDPVVARNTTLTTSQERLRFDLIREEFEEVCFELGFRVTVLSVRHGHSRSLRRLAKELADLTYVTTGTFERTGIDGDEVLRRVHNSNMSKVGPDGRIEHRADGKVLKGPNYAPPDLSWIPDGSQ